MSGYKYKRVVVKNLYWEAPDWNIVKDYGRPKDFIYTKIIRKLITGSP